MHQQWFAGNMQKLFWGFGVHPLAPASGNNDDVFIQSGYNETGILSIRSRSDDQHGITVREEVIFLFNSDFICFHQKIVTSEGRDQHEH